MKRLVGILMMSVLAVSVQAQNDAITKYFSKYADNDDFSHVTVSGKMFSMINQIEVEDDEDKAMVESLGKIKGVKALFAEEGVDGASMYKEAIGLIDGKGYEELMSVRESDKDIKFMIKEKGNKIDELFMVMGGDNEFALVSIVGDGIDINQLYKLSKNIGMSEFDHLKKMGGN